MPTRKTLIHLTLIMLSGFAGGFVASCATTPAGVAAEPAEPMAPEGAGPGIVEAREFRLVDTSGEVRAVLGFLPDGTPRLSFGHEATQTRVFVGVLPDGTGALILGQGEPGPEVRVEASRAGLTGLAALDSQGLDRMGMGVLPDDRCGLSLQNARGGEVASVVVYPSGLSNVILLDEQGRPKDLTKSVNADPRVY
jgi:hypothetical protein